MKKKYYKVCAVDHSAPKGERFLSSNMTLGYTLPLYIPGKWVYAPKNSRLFVFGDKREAMDYAYSYESVWECEVTPGVLHGQGIENFGYIKYFWDKVEKNLKAKKKWDAGIEDTRTGVEACLVKGVKLTKQIK